MLTAGDQPLPTEPAQLIAIPVLIYHHINPHVGDTVTVTPDVFADQIKYLADNGYRFLTVEELVRHISAEIRIDEKSVLITFDDGWLDNYLYAVPVLKKYRAKATFFLITGRVDAATNRVRPFDVEIPDHEAAKRLILTGHAERVVLDWDTIRSLDRSGLFRFYSHTVTHRRCVDLSAGELGFELSESKNRIETELDKACDYLCWPYGSYNQSCINSAAVIGYKGMFTTVDGFCLPGSDVNMIQRIEVCNSVEWLKNRLSVESS